MKGKEFDRRTLNIINYGSTYDKWTQEQTIRFGCKFCTTV